MDDHGRSPSSNQPILYVLDTNVLIHDPNALLNFEEHHVAIPMIVLEELDKLKSGHHSVAAECRQAIRLIDKTLGDATPEDVELGVPIQRGKSGPKGLLSILMGYGLNTDGAHGPDEHYSIEMFHRGIDTDVYLMSSTISRRAVAGAWASAAGEPGIASATPAPKVPVRNFRRDNMGGPSLNVTFTSFFR